MLPQEVVLPEVEWTITAVSFTADLIAIAVKPSQDTSNCPGCSVSSNRIHSHYIRTAADLPWQGRRVILRVTVRRFRCPNGGCSQRIFCERLSHLAAWAQTTDRLSEAHRLIGLALGGEAGSRLTNHLAVPTSPDTLLRRVKRTPHQSHPTPRFLGVDDFAFRRGESYGTILMDLERRVVVDLLPDRAAGTLAAWLRAHPGVEVVSRDRASAYAQAAREAAPNATQVADRFHLLMNLRKAVERSLARQSPAVREAFRQRDEPEENGEGDRTPEPDNEGRPRSDPASPKFSTAKQQAIAGKRALRQERFDRVRQLHRDGVPLRQIGKSLRLHFLTVQKYIRGEECPIWRSALKGIPAPSPLDPFRDQIRNRVQDGGVANAKALFRDLRAQGYPGGYSPVRRAVQRLTQQDRRFGPRGIPLAAKPIPPPTRHLPSARRLSFAIARRGDQRSNEETRFLQRLRQAEPDVTATVSLAERLATLIRTRTESGLDAWLADAQASDLPEFRSLAASLRQDEDAVRAGMSLPWSNGPVEGAVNRLKMIKRSMFGRAGFDLLKSRVLNTG